ncbi:MAG: T9SS type A sorting domain-containing protein [Flavobacteriales bacterium]|nr:T9SS type A sorting domain-containing protein [Flavobacteriales bacterium]
MKWEIIIFFFLLQVGIANAQQPRFFRTYGGGNFDVAQSIIQNSDSSYVIAGATSSYNVQGADMLLFKIDPQGNQLWMKTIGGAQNDWARRIMHAPGGTGYILAGHTNSFGAGAYDAYIVHTNLNGDTIWTRTIGGSDWDFVYGLDTTSDGNIVLCGETSSFGNGNRDAWIIKMNMNGDTLWTRMIGGAQDDVANHLFEDRDGNLVVLGSTKSWGLGLRDGYFIKLNASGDTIFTKRFGTEHDEWFTSGDMYFDNSNNMSYCFGGNRYHLTEDITVESLMRVQANGTQLYEIAGGPQFPYERKQTIVKNEGNWGTFYCAFTFWDRSATNHFQIDIRRTTYGFGAYTYSNTFGSPSQEYTWDVLKTLDKGYILVGQIENYGPGPTACFIAKTDSFGVSVSQTAPVLNIEETILASGIAVFPNPASDKIQVVFELPLDENSKAILMDLNGRKMMEANIPAGQHNFILDVSTFSSGIYLLQLSNSRFLHQSKILIAR